VCDSGVIAFQGGTGCWVEADSCGAAGGCDATGSDGATGGGATDANDASGATGVGAAGDGVVGACGAAGSCGDAGSSGTAGSCGATGDGLYGSAAFPQVAQNRASFGFSFPQFVQTILHLLSFHFI